jgi:hypothetical protein
MAFSFLSIRGPFRSLITTTFLKHSAWNAYIQPSFTWIHVLDSSATSFMHLGPYLMMQKLDIVTTDRSQFPPHHRLSQGTYHRITASMYCFVHAHNHTSMMADVDVPWLHLSDSDLPDSHPSHEMDVDTEDRPPVTVSHRSLETSLKRKRTMSLASTPKVSC